MKPVFSVLFSLMVLAPSVAAEAFDLAAFIRKADTVSLFSIFPQQVHVTDEHGNPTEEDRKKDRFLGYPVFGKIVDTQGATRASIQEALVGALSSVEEGPPPLCFEPRHAVCLKHGEMHIDMLICFECGQARYRQIEIRGAEEISRKEEIIFIGIRGHDVLSQILDAHKIVRDLPSTEPRQPAQPTRGKAPRG
jgi:hypothetical protein